MLWFIANVATFFLALVGAASLAVWIDDEIVDWLYRRQQWKAYRELVPKRAPLAAWLISWKHMDSRKP